ncbi:oxidoreductase [Corynebacterium glyciniphilum]|uniref:oxidoreductase n=1 Tax=Corynebacterium glyciniphilum TaxID=1404244 RepID=UPI003DA00BC9
MSTWFITGCSTGLGRALASAVLAAGHKVVITARNVSSLSELAAQYPDTAFPVALDVTDRDEIHEAVRRALEQVDAIDVLVNNAGYGYRAAVEEASPVDVERLFATNFHGPVELIKEVLPGMRKRRTGTIVNISSIAVNLSPAGSGYYAATKAALEGMSGSLRREVSPLGIHVITVEPGAFRTDFAGRSLTQSTTAIGDYAETAGQRRIENDHTDGMQSGDPVRAARALMTAVGASTPPSFLLLGTDAHDVVTEALSSQWSEIEEWKELTSSTDFDV